MIARILLLFITCFFGVSTIKAQESPITFNTVRLTNQQYLITTDWKTIPIDLETGEDVNSKLYGGIFKNPKSLTSDFHNGRTTIARNFLEIRADLLNNSNDEFFIESVFLNIVKVYPLSEVKYETGTWDVDLGLGYSFSTDFEIDRQQLLYEISPNRERIKSKNDDQGSRINLRVATTESTRNDEVVLEFNIRVKVSTIGTKREAYEIISEKTYFIAAL